MIDTMQYSRAHRRGGRNIQDEACIEIVSLVLVAEVVSEPVDSIWQLLASGGRFQNTVHDSDVPATMVLL